MLYKHIVQNNICLNILHCLKQQADIGNAILHATCEVPTSNFTIVNLFCYGKFIYFSKIVKLQHALLLSVTDSTLQSMTRIDDSDRWLGSVTRIGDSDELGYLPVPSLCSRLPRLLPCPPPLRAPPKLWLYQSLLFITRVHYNGSGECCRSSSCSTSSHTGAAHSGARSPLIYTPPDRNRYVHACMHACIHILYTIQGI